MFKAIILTLVIVTLPGCGILSFFTNEETETEVLVHPELPRPVQNQTTDWIIIENEEGVFVAAPYQQFLNHLEGQEDILRYIRQINSTVCYYRKELEEEFCQPYKESEE